MTIRMYHPNLEPPNNECEALDDNQAAIYRQSGWLDAPEPEKREGYEPEPVKYAPVEPEPSAKAKATRKSATPAEDKE